MTASSLTSRLGKRLLMSFVGTAVTGAAGYAGKKAPQLIEDKLMPKLREATSQPGGDVVDAPKERAQAVVGRQEVDRGPAERLSPAQRDARRHQRAAHREARRTGSGAKED
jgi:hypothetical protein